LLIGCADALWEAENTRLSTLFVIFVYNAKRRQRGDSISDAAPVRDLSGIGTRESLLPMAELMLNSVADLRPHLTDRA